ncbi:hypothetical protein IQ265_12705 [Nodosilinea sp. LEGE 06152]|uniref:hypothetical protein n=1 Tax=Nodosilinea sp. LEGE 06152 TaxID=2777966 RepID=UPI00187E8C46|nr:hypothetical protein [Nodosilinea sp. LEGE 06152]MBE9157679.1 hypothetical protein [Nodosilinea sp. LEGE 06152]
MTGRPYSLPPWSTDAIRELLDTLNCLNNGLYENPKDLSDCLHATAESVRLVLDPDEFADNTPQLLDAIAVLYIALQLAANEAALYHPYPQDHAATFERWTKAAIDTVSSTPGDQLRDLITGTLSRLAQLRAEQHHSVPHIVYSPAAAGGTPPFPAWLTPDDGRSVSPEVWELGKSMLRQFFEGDPDDTPTAGDLDPPDDDDVSDNWTPDVL